MPEGWDGPASSQVQGDDGLGVDDLPAADHLPGLLQGHPAYHHRLILFGAAAAVLGEARDSVKVDFFVAEARRSVDGREQFPVLPRQAGFLRQFPLPAAERVLTGLQLPRRDLPNYPADGMPVLLQ